MPIRFPPQSWFNDLTSYLKGKFPWTIIIHFQVCCSCHVNILLFWKLQIQQVYPHCVYVFFMTPCYHLVGFFHTCLNFLNDPLFCTYYFPNVSTTPLRQWGFRQCLPFNWTTLRVKHYRHHIVVMGVVDMFGH